MNKYEKMLALNRKASDEKIERARKAILQLMDEREPVTVLKLMEKTGLSRGFFYKNPMVRKELDRAFEQQAGMINPKKKILDMAMNHEIQSLLRQLGELMKENETLKKALERKNRDLIYIL